MTALVVERVELSALDAALADTLGRLNAASPRPCPFFSLEYIATYLVHNEKYAPRDMSPFFLLVKRGREVIGALPLKRVWNRTSGVPFRQIEFMVATEVDLPSVLAASEDQTAVVSALMDYLPRLLVAASVVHLINLPEQSALYQARQRAETLWSRVLVDPGMPISYLKMEYASPAEYYRKLNKKMRSNVSRLARRLAAEGELQYLTGSAPAALRDLFKVYLDIEDRSWKRGSEASLRRHPERALMYQGIHRNSDKVEHHIDVILLAGVPIAALMSFCFGKTVFAMETCYDERYAALGPSNLLLFLGVDRAIRVGATEYSLHGHFDYYKHRWLAESVPTNEVRIVRRGSFPDLRSAVGRLVRQRRGQTEREVAIPKGQQETVAAIPPPLPSTQALASQLRNGNNVTCLDQAALATRLPFDLVGKT